MTVKSERVYWVECDGISGGCSWWALHGYHYEGLPFDAAEAVDEATDAGWLRIDGKWYCPTHKEIK